MTPCNRFVLESGGELGPDELLEGDASGVIDGMGLLDWPDDEFELYGRLSFDDGDYVADRGAHDMGFDI